MEEKKPSRDRSEESIEPSKPERIDESKRDYHKPRDKRSDETVSTTHKPPRRPEQDD